MISIAWRLRDLRVKEKLSQRDLEDRTGFPRSYISRVENGHTVPTIQTLEKWAEGLRIPLYELFYDEGEPRAARSGSVAARRRKVRDLPGQGRFFDELRKVLADLDMNDRHLFLAIAEKLAKPESRR